MLNTSTNIMNVWDSVNETRCYFKLINGTIFFIQFHMTQTALIKGQNIMHAMAELRQSCMNDLHDRNDATLNEAAKEHETISYETRK